MSHFLKILLAVSLLAGESTPVRGHECCERFREQLSLGQYRQVLEEGRPLLERVAGERLVELLAALGAASFQLGQFAGATQYWERGLALQPEDSRLRIDLAQAWIHRGNSGRALTLLEGVPDGRWAGERYALAGNIALADGDVSRAISYFEKGLPLLPEGWVEPVRRNLTFSYDRLARQLLVLAGEVEGEERAQILRQVADLREKMASSAAGSDDLAIAIWRWERGGEGESREALLARVGALPLSLQKGSYFLQLGAFGRAREVAAALENSSLLTEVAIAEASARGNTGALQAARWRAESDGDWYGSFQIDRKLAEIHWQEGEPEAAKRHFRSAHQNLIRHSRLNALSGERKLAASQFFQQSIPIFFESGAPEDLLLLKSLLKNNQLLQVALFYNLPCSIESAENSFQDGELVLYYFFARERGYVLSERNAALERKVLPVTREEMAAWVAQWRQDLRNTRNSNYRESGQKLYEVLLGSLDWQGASRIGVVADSTLQGLPFAALYDGRQFLVEQLPVSYLSRDFAPPPPSRGELLAMGASEFSGEGDPLPHAAREIEGAVSLVGGDVLVDREFTEGNIARQLEKKRYSTVHIATHGYFGGNAERSWLQTSDGRLSVAELSRILAAGSPFDLLVLSGCETGRGNSRLVYGLAGIGLQLGIRAVVASQWAVGDLDASQLMVAFYQSLQRGRSPAKALQEAQIAALRNPAQHPNAWAGFVALE